MNVQRPLDVWKMVVARRGLEGRQPLSVFPRLAGLLFDSAGEVHFGLDFDRDALGVAYVELSIDTVLPLQCQRSLQRFGFPVGLRQRLGLMRHEADEAGLPPGYEPFLVPENGEVRALDLVEDELILSLPVVALDPDRTAFAPDVPPVPAVMEPVRDNPFAVLATLRQKS